MSAQVFNLQDTYNLRRNAQSVLGREIIFNNQTRTVSNYNRENPIEWSTLLTVDAYKDNAPAKDSRESGQVDPNLIQNLAKNPGYKKN